MTHQAKFPSMLVMDIGKEYIHCVMRHEGRSITTIISHSADGFADLLNWLRAHAVRRVHAICDAMAVRSQAVADFMRFAGHDVTVLNEQQMAALQAGIEALKREELAEAA